MKGFKSLLVAILVAAGSTNCWSSEAADDAPGPRIDSDGTVHVPAFAIPLSRYMSEEAKQQFINGARRQAENSEKVQKDPPIARKRAERDDLYRPIVDRARSLYPVNVEDRRIGGIPTQVVTPKDGISAGNANRVLINLHGGGFVVGAGLGGLAESIPVAAGGKMKVVSVDYRMAPEHHFPAASQDVAAVYAALLKQYKPENIGIYGCSAGGILAAMAVAWIEKEKLPRPGAIGIFHAGAYGSFYGSPTDANSWGGDSSFVAPLLVGGKWPSPIVDPMDYTGNVDKQDPLASPALSTDLLAKFPPTLLITSTRAWDMSAAVQTHRLLTRAGIHADLHLWDGMGHCFLFDVHLPESQEAYQVIARFFDTNLGRQDR